MNNETTNRSPAIRLYSIPQAAKVLSISRSTLYSLIGAGKVKAVKLGKLARIQDIEVDRYIATLPAAEIGRGRADG
ncbi:helix-turn-helix domain-containing protein [Mesorhizobium sp. B1-1-5]|uniref:helix-turn-helix domain-containing protein n=1 Tax=Mesorhizobium sp. B1-1-5 TaxID=2589979 RepID=UPI00112D66D9|nr:helix-turn-helix domain-containing protein [Mesorhizobium sp. B1-1-5]TPO02180.1 helix-turn-helix domain-containing protein [Mesorhizobium sp. B1-1-5]